MKSARKILLNSDQQEAVSYNSGPLLIIAGAGTGKTSVITEKIKYLVMKKNVKPDEILALTFTEKAASEMEERVDKALPYGYFQMWISTFHSFADQILREEASHIGISPTYRLMSSAETVIFLRKNLFLLNLSYFRPLGNPHKFLEDLVDHFSRLKDENISPEEYLAWARTKKDNPDERLDREKYLELARAYKTYQDLKIKEAVFDFSDLIYYLLLLFKKRKSILSKYQKKFRYVLVDEFQDTNIAQYALIKSLCPPLRNPRLTVVGDDSQAIYKFRGASISNILIFKKDYRRTRQVTLRKNYRSNQQVLDSAYRLIKHNDPDTLEAQLGISKDLLSQRRETEQSRRINKVHFSLATRVEEEADYVASQIRRLVYSKKYAFSDIALLVRANNHADPFIRAFAQKRIPYQFLGPGVLFKQAEVKDIVAYLTFLSDIQDSVSLYRVLSMEIFDLDKKDVASLLSLTHRTTLSLFQALEIYLAHFDASLMQEEFAQYQKHLPHISKPTREKLAVTYAMIIRHLKLIKKEAAGQILYFFLEDTGYLERLANFKTAKEERAGLNISKFFDKIKRYELEHEDASVFAVVDYIKMSMELGESPLAAYDDLTMYNAVNILTVHSSKGLEFPVVFMVNLTQQRFPTREQKEKLPIPTSLIKEILPTGNPHLLEERRLFYVGATRAQDHLFMTAAQFYAGGKRERRISPFVEETLGQERLRKIITKREEEKKQLTMFEYKKSDDPEVISKEAPVLSSVSYSQLETYLLCPLRYKYQYVLRVPTPPTAAASFGITIHQALEDFYQEVIDKKKPTVQNLLKHYRQSWVPVGYLSKAHEESRKREGEQMLKNYFETFHKKNLHVIDVERLFKIKVKDIVVTGKIDRVDKTAGNGIEIVDYKTGKKPDEKKLRDSLQLSIYLLAASDKTTYGAKAHKVDLTFYYLSDNSKITMQKTEADVINVKKKITETVADIKTGIYTPHVGPWCDFCPFKMVCEAWQ